MGSMLYTLIRVKPPKAVPLIFRAEGKLGETQGPLHDVWGPGFNTVQGQSFGPKPLNRGMVAERTSEEHNHLFVYPDVRNFAVWIFHF